MGYPAGASAQRHRHERTGTVKSNTHGLFRLMPIRTKRIHSFRPGLQTEIKSRDCRLKLNPALAAHGNDISNNILKFLGMAITLYLPLIEYKEMGQVHELVLILGDNTSAILDHQIIFTKDIRLLALRPLH